MAAGIPTSGQVKLTTGYQIAAKIYSSVYNSALQLDQYQLQYLRVFIAEIRPKGAKEM